MPFQQLPPEVVDLLAKYAAPPRLVAHLTVVNDVAITLIKRVDAHWPQLDYDQARGLILQLFSTFVRLESSVSVSP